MSNTSLAVAELAQLDMAIARLERALVTPVDPRLYAAFRGCSHG